MIPLVKVTRRCFVPVVHGSHGEQVRKRTFELRVDCSSYEVSCIDLQNLSAYINEHRGLRSHVLAAKRSMRLQVLQRSGRFRASFSTNSSCSRHSMPRQHLHGNLQALDLLRQHGPRSLHPGCLSCNLLKLDRRQPTYPNRREQCKWACLAVEKYDLRISWISRIAYSSLLMLMACLLTSASGTIALQEW